MEPQAGKQVEPTAWHAVLMRLLNSSKVGMEGQGETAGYQGDRRGPGGEVELAHCFVMLN
jgi:hypothetical protein